MMKFKKKDAAITENLLVLLVGIFITMAVIVIIMGAFKSISDKWEMRQIAREYILQMETEGYLSSSNEASLIKALENYGLYNISLNDTTVSEVPYGSKITLSIEGTYEDNILVFAGAVSKITSNPTTVKIIRQSTAKQ